MSTTLRGDTIDLTSWLPWALVAFYENLGLITRNLRTDPNAPFRLNNTELLKQTGQFFNAPKWNRIANLIQRQDLTNGGAAATTKMTSRNDAGVRLDWKMQNVQVADSIFDQDGITKDQVAEYIGRQVGEQWALELRTKCVGLSMALAGAMTATAHDFDEYAASGTKANLRAQSLASAAAKMGDRAPIFKMQGAWIFHSNAQIDLLLNQLGSLVAGIADVTVNNGTIATLGMPYDLADDSVLNPANGGSYNYCYSLGVGPGAIDLMLEDMKAYEPFLDRTLENPSWIYAGRVRLGINANGFKYDSANMGANPTNTTLFNTASWIPQYSSHKEVPIVRVRGNCSAN